MSNWALPPRLTLVTGRSGSGKNTFCYRYILNALRPQPCNPEPLQGVFIFDWKNEAEQRLGVRAVTTEHGFEAALASRIVIFNPHAMFPGDREIEFEGKTMVNDDKMALRWFCNKVWNVSQRSTGRKMVYIDEVRQFATATYIPPALGRIVRLGRSENLELLSSTQYPRDYHADIRGGATEWIAFNTTEEKELEAIRPYLSCADELPGLPLGSYIAVTRPEGVQLRGKMF